MDDETRAEILKRFARPRRQYGRKSALNDAVSDFLPHILCQRADGMSWVEIADNLSAKTLFTAGAVRQAVKRVTYSLNKVSKSDARSERRGKQTASPHKAKQKRSLAKPRPTVSPESEPQPPSNAASSPFSMRRRHDPFADEEI